MSEVARLIARPSEGSGLIARLRRLLDVDFVQKVISTYVTRIVLISLGLITAILVSRLLGPKGRGEYAAAMALGAIGVQLGTLGLHTSNTYFVAKNRQLLPSLLGNTLLASLGVGVVGAVVMLGMFLAWPKLAPVHGTLLVLAVIWIPLGLGYVLTQNLILGLGEVKTYNAVEVANRSVVLGLIIGLFMAGAVRTSIVFATGVAGLALTFGWMVVHLSNLSEGFPQPSVTLFRENLNYGLKAYFASFFCFLVLRADLLMVKYLRGAEDAGYYSIAATMADYVAMLPTVVSAMLLPKLAASHDIVVKLHMTRKAVVGSVALVAPLLLVSAMVAPTVVRLLFGRSFLPAVPAYIWLMPGMLFLAIHMVAVQFLNSIGYPIIVVWIWAGSALLNIAANAWAIPTFGIAGASIVSSISYFLACVLILAVIYRYSEDAKAIG